MGQEGAHSLIVSSALISAQTIIWGLHFSIEKSAGVLIAGTMP